MSKGASKPCPYGGPDCFACPLPDCALTTKCDAITINRLETDRHQPLTPQEALLRKRQTYAAQEERRRKARAAMTEAQREAFRARQRELYRRRKQREKEGEGRGSI